MYFILPFCRDDSALVQRCCNSMLACSCFDDISSSNLAILLFAAISLSLAILIWSSKLNAYCYSSDLWIIYCCICYCSYDYNKFSNLAISRSLGSGLDVSFWTFISCFISSGWLFGSSFGSTTRLKRPIFVPLCLGDNVI